MRGTCPAPGYRSGSDSLQSKLLSSKTTTMSHLKKESPRCVADSSETATHQEHEEACGEETGPSTEPEQGNERASGTDKEVGVTNTRPSARRRTSARPCPRTDPGQETSAGRAEEKAGLLTPTSSSAPRSISSRATFSETDVPEDYAGRKRTTQPKKPAAKTPFQS
ncbi:hypothetical protein OJAV_G00235280 [Oryzias javanicus]|uniref:Uncharacterized protein n=1 Tax=Oryzias javanicus TaxID=123683 RepID=A0A437BYK0_ORYJA|nr:hypothetical protein OJAV_G00235280 [Oryzias javanicus]